MRQRSHIWAVIAGVTAIAAAAPASADTIVVEWSNAAMQSVRTTHPGPPMVARMLAITQTCIYDAWAAYSKHAIGTRLGGNLRRPRWERTDANKATAISFAAHRCLVDLFPSQTAYLDGIMTAHGYNPADASTDVTTPQGIGNVAAQAVLDFRHHDGANQLGDLHPGAYSDYTGYVPANDPDHINDASRWQPLRLSDGHGGFVVQKFVGPFWENVVPFGLKSADQFDSLVDGPQHAGTAGYKQQVDEVLAYSANLTDRDKVIAEYWADGPSSELPPGHWGLFCQFVSQRDHHGIDDDAQMFFVLGNAMLDASIVAWHMKRIYDSVRPVTAVHAQYAGQRVNAWAGPYLGTRMIPAESWRPYQAATVVTPPFPEYLSGHSLFSRTGAEILKAWTGSDTFGNSVTIAAGSSRVEHGAVPAANVTLSWATFTDAANEAGLSRRFGGIHFVDGDLDARSLGPKVARAAWKKAQKYFHGVIDHCGGDKDDDKDDD